MAIDNPFAGLSGGSKFTLEESRHLIDERKVELYELIRQLNSRRNELSPISTLPPELLGRIFAFVIANNHWLTSVDFTLSISFTHVSQNWRDIALNTPELWDTPAFRYPTWARAMLERSKMVDLVVYSDISCANPALMKEVFDNHVAQIREIELHNIDSSFSSSILENIRPSSLRLRSLQLSAERAEEGDRIPLFPAHLLVQPDGLRCLTITHCSFDLYAQPRPLLTHLSMTAPGDRPLLSEFATALSGMPALETLDMIHSLPLATKAVKLGLKVELPNLSLLHLCSKENFEVLNVVDFLVVPRTASIRLFCFNAMSEDPLIEIPDIVSPLDHFFSCMTGSIERGSYNGLRLFDGVALVAWRGERSSGGGMDLSLNLAVKDHWSHFLDKMLHSLPLFDLQTLLIDINFGKDVIRSFFGQSATIQTVELQYKAVVSDFLEALTHKPEGYDRLESSYYSVSFPALRSLQFHYTTFDGDTLGQLSDCLMERYERGAELQELSIWMCYGIDDEHIKLLREVVPDVVYFKF